MTVLRSIVRSMLASPVFWIGAIILAIGSLFILSWVGHWNWN